PSASTARRIASSAALRMFRLSISSTEACAIANAIARSLIFTESSSLISAVKSFESFNPRIFRSGFRMTAAAYTGPASGPRPASPPPHPLSASAIHHSQNCVGRLLRRALLQHRVDLAELLRLPLARRGVVQEREERLGQRAGRRLLLHE